MGSIGSIYVDVRGNTTTFERDIVALRSIAKKGGTEVSNALNNAINPSKAERGMKDLSESLVRLSQSAKAPAANFKATSAAIASGMEEAAAKVGMTGKQFQVLNEKMLRNQAMVTAEASLRSIGKTAGLSNKELKALAMQMGHTAKQAEAMANKIDRSQTAHKSFLTSLNGIRNGLLNVSVLAAAVIYPIKQMSEALWEAGRATKVSENAYKEITGSVANANVQFQFLRKTADDLGLNFYTLREGYKGFLAAAQTSKIPMQEVQAIFKSVSNAGAVLGLSNERVGLTFLALEQMMSKGKVSMEEIRRQMGDNIPGAFQLGAKAMGMTVEAFDKAVSAGEVFSDDFLPKFRKALDENFKGGIDESVKAANKLAEAWEELKNKMAASGFMDLATKAIKDFTDVLKDPGVIENLQGIAESLGELLVLSVKLAAIGAKLFPGGETKKIATAIALGDDEALMSLVNKGAQHAISETTEGWSEYTKVVSTVSPAVETAAKAQKLSEDALKETDKAIKFLNVEYAKLTIQTGGYADEELRLKNLDINNWYEEQAEVLGKNNKVLNETVRLKRELAQQEQDFKNRFSNIGMTWDDSGLADEAQIAYQAEQELKAVSDRKKAEEDLAKSRDKWAEDYKKSQEKALEAYVDFSDTIKDNIKDIIENHENMADKIVSIFKDMLYEIAASIIAQNFVIPIGLQIGSALGASWNGTSFSSMASSGSNLLNTASGANSLYNAANGGVSNFLTTGLGGKVGSSIFGNSNWYGTGASMAGTSAAYYGGAEYMVAAGAEAAGTAGIASTLSALAPYAAIAAIAIPLITSLFEDDPTPAIGIQGGSWEEESPSTGSLNSTKYNYKLFAQDMGGESSATLLEFFDTRFAAVDEALSGAFAETLEKYDAGAKNRGWVYTEGMDTDAILEAVSNNVFEGILDGLKTVTMGSGFESFGVDFFESIKGDDEDLFQAFIDFNTVVEGTTDFLEKFSGQMTALGDDSLQAFLNLESIMGIFTEMDAMMDPLIKITDPLVQIIDQFETWIDALNDSLATLEEVTEAEKNRTTALGMQVSGLTATNVSSALQQAIMGGDTGSLISDIMKQSVSSSLAVSLTNEVIEKYITPFNIKLGEVFDAVGGDVEKMFDYLPYIIDQLDISSIISEVDALSEKWDDFFDNAGIDIDSLTSSRNSAGQEYLSALESELSILEDKAATAKENYLSLLDDELSAQQDIVSALTPAIKSLQDFKSEMWSTAGTIGVTGKSIYASQMSSLASSAMSGDTESIDSLLSVSEKYLDTAKSTSVSWIDYARDLAKTSVLLTGVEDSAVDQLSEAEKQTEYLEGLMDEVNGVSSNVTDIAAARAAYESAQMELDNSWMQEEIATLKSLLDSSQTIEQLMQAFFAAQAALITAQTTADPEAAYLAANPDVAAAVAAGQFTSGQEHYDLYGKYEGRGATGYASLTKEDTYLANNLDVAQAVQSGQFASGLEHYLMYGLNEGRQFRDGGFISGPDSGYKMPDATFHGDEWIIPNKKLPDNDAVVKAIEKQTERLETLNYQTVKNTLETTKLLKRFNDVDAMKVRVIA